MVAKTEKKIMASINNLIHRIEAGKRSLLSRVNSLSFLQKNIKYTQGHSE
jgi:hypothetical protein